jgi:hypothetical protein
MDSRFTLPGTNRRFGLDPLLGLIPFVGDAISFTISALLVSSLWRYNASGEIKARLIVNILLDFALGSIPVIGSIWDFFFKANERNLKLVKAHYQEGKYQGNSRGFVLQSVVILLVILLLALYGMAMLIAALVRTFQ